METSREYEHSSDSSQKDDLPPTASGYEREAGETEHDFAIAPPNSAAQPGIDTEDGGELEKTVTQRSSGRISVNNVKAIPNGGLQAWLQVLGAFFLFFNCTYIRLKVSSAPNMGQPGELSTRSESTKRTMRQISWLARPLLISPGLVLCKPSASCSSGQSADRFTMLEDFAT